MPELVKLRENSKFKTELNISTPIQLLAKPTSLKKRKSRTTNI